MKIDPECFPCILRRAIACSRRTTDDAWLQHKLLGKVMAELSTTDRDDSPAEVMLGITGVVSSMLGSTDLFQAERSEWMQELAGVIAHVRESIGGQEDPLLCALACAARADVFADETLTQAAVRKELSRLGLKAGDGCHEELAVRDDYEGFRKEIAQAESLLIVHDTGPALHLDRILVEQLRALGGELRVTSVVRAAPVLLQATRDDVERTGLDEVVDEVMDPGAPMLGLTLNDSSRELRERFEQASVVLAIGQAHWQTLADCGRRIYHLMRVKCSVIARSQGVRPGDTVFLRA